MRSLPGKLMGIMLLLAAAAASAMAGKHDPLQAQRALFLEARAALNQGQLEAFRRLQKQLQDYPLTPYLEFDALRARLQSANEEEIARFIDRYQDLPLAARLRRSWLHTLARQQRWPLFLKYYRPPQSIELQCQALRARLKTGKRENIHQDIITLWLVGTSRPEACDPVFDFLYRSGKLSDDLLWQRIRLAMRNNKPSLAGYLARRLPAADAAWVKLWRDIHSHPDKHLQDPRLGEDTPRAREIIAHALRRIARFDAEQAHEKWQLLRASHAFDPQASADIEKTIALQAAWQRRPVAYDWLAALPETAVDERVGEWRIRTALAAGRWSAVLDCITALPAEQQNNDEWQYWKAVALEKLERRLDSMNDFALLARERSYHGFLAADYLRWPYEMGNQPIEYDEAALDALASRPAMLRAHELYRANLLTDARREWAQFTGTLSAVELKLAAVLASRWGWHDRAILTVAQAGDYDDLVLRFPLEHEDSVRVQARKNRLDPGYVFAVIRQESAFNKEARSPAGARGLMQLMPGTGRLTARQHRIPYSGTQSLYEAEKNISLGTRYLHQVGERFNGNTVLATAAYNAGPHRVQKWLTEEQNQQAANWVAVIPFTETRRYVQRVLAYAAIYDWRMGRPVTPLKKRMPVILEKSEYSRNSRQ